MNYTINMQLNTIRCFVLDGLRRIIVTLVLYCKADTEFIYTTTHLNKKEVED